eukprot:316454-Amphidinium_carterae.1
MLPWKWKRAWRQKQERARANHPCRPTKQIFTWMAFGAADLCCHSILAAAAQNSSSYPAREALPSPQPFVSSQGCQFCKLICPSLVKLSMTCAQKQNFMLTCAVI